MLRCLLIAIIILLLPPALGKDSPAKPTTITLTILDHPLYAEIAHTPATRSKGLMYRSELDENSGMLFIFPHVEIYSMWMLNTSIPLSVAFLDEHGVILNIADMIPFSVTPHYSIKPAKYALEMNLGWFAKKAIKAGHQVQGFAQVPQAK